MLEICIATAQLVLGKRMSDKLVSGRERKEKEQKRSRQIMQVYGGDKVMKRIKKADKESIMKLFEQ